MSTLLGLHFTDRESNRPLVRSLATDLHPPDVVLSDQAISLIISSPDWQMSHGECLCTVLGASCFPSKVSISTTTITPSGDRFCSSCESE